MPAEVTLAHTGPETGDEGTQGRQTAAHDGYVHLDGGPDANGDAAPFHLHDLVKGADEGEHPEERSNADAAGYVSMESDIS